MKNQDDIKKLDIKEDGAESNSYIEEQDYKIVESKTSIAMFWTWLKSATKTLLFFGCLICIIYFNAITFIYFQTWGAPIAIAIFELLFIIVLSDKLKIKVISTLIDRWLKSIGK